MNTIPISIMYQGMLLTGYANSQENFEEAPPSSLIIYIQGWCIGTLRYCDHEWSMDKPIDSSFVESLGNYIYSYMSSLNRNKKLK